MAEIKNISVLVIGNPVGSSGVGEIVMYNSPQFCLHHDSRPGLDGNSYYFSIKIENNYTVYKIVKNNVRSNTAFRGGYLAIAFSIPRGYELSTSNPYRVLIDLWQSFSKSCMNLKDAQLEVYEFNSKQIQTNVLDNIASSISLRQVRKPYRPMNRQGGIALVVQPEEKIEQLLSDVQYTEFSNFSEILVAESAGNTESYTLLTDLKIPRPCSYKLIVDGEERKDAVTDKAKVLDISSTKDTRCYENGTKSFSINDILVDHNVVLGVEIDEENEEIKVSTAGWAKPKQRQIHVSIVPPFAKEYFAKNKNLLSITNKLEPVVLDDNWDVFLKGDEILSPKFDVTIEQNGQYTLKDFSYSNSTIEIIALKVAASVPPPGYVNKKYQVSGKTSEQNEKKCVDVRVELGEKGIEDESTLMVCCKKTAEGKKEDKIMSMRVNLKKDTQKHVIFFVIPLLKEWNSIHLCFQTKKYKFKTKECINLKQDECTITLNDFRGTKKCPISDNDILRLFCLLVVFVVGFLCGYGTFSWWNSSDDPDRQEKTNAAGSYLPNQSLDDNRQLVDQEEQEAKAFLSKVKDSLDRKDVSFDCIRDLYRQYVENYDKYEEWDKTLDVYYKIRAYNNLVDSIESGKIAAAKEYVNNENISELHKQKLMKLDNNNYTNATSFDTIEAVEEYDEKETCKQCGQEINRSKLRRHLLDFHPYICEMKKKGVKCNERFVSQKDLIAHQKKSHKTESER